jgi:hypothetical protein
MRANRNEEVEAPSAGHCPLCREYLEGECKECPICEYAGETVCEGTPYYEAHEAFYGECEKDWRKAAKKEIKFLERVKDLLVEDNGDDE